MRVRVGGITVTGGIRAAVQRVLDSGRFSEGPEVASFEREWARHTGTAYSVLVNSGSSALLVALLALRDELCKVRATKVILPALSYVADTNAVLAAGYEPRYVDINPDTFGIEPQAIVKSIEKAGPDSIAAILVVHLMGYMVNMPEILEIAAKYDIPVLEDAAQAHGARLPEGEAGSFGDASVFSFYMAHNIAVGELGSLNTNDEDIAKLARQLKANGRMCSCEVCAREQGGCPHSWHLRDPKFIHVVAGYNFKATEWSAAIARAQLVNARDRVAHRRGIFSAYAVRLKKHTSWLKLPPYREGMSPFAYPLVVSPKVSVSKVRELLGQKGVETRPMFSTPPLYVRTIASVFPCAAKAAQNGFYIGCHEGITADDVSFVGDVFDEIGKQYAHSLG